MKKDIWYKIAKSISNFLTVVLMLAIAVCFYSFLSLTVLSKKYVNFFSYTIFQIGSDSMAPTITTKDLIIVHITKNIEEDDVITFEEGNILVTHRVISKTQQGYITKGDANNEKDKSITSEQVVGKVIRILPNMGVWFKVLTTPKVVLSICVTLFLFSIALSYTEKRKLSKKDDFGIYFSGIKMKQGDRDD